MGGHSQAYGRNDLNLGFTKEDEPQAVERNRILFLRKVLSSPERRTEARMELPDMPQLQVFPIVTLRQFHSDVIHCVDTVPDEPLSGDGLITATPGLILGVQTADCLPVMIVDVKRKAIGVFHAGWRGTVKRIVEKGVGEMRRYFDSNPRDLKAVIGPGIHGCCYEIGEEVRTQFESQFGYAAKLFRQVEDPDPVREKYPMLFLTARAPGHGVLPKKIFLDLAEANRQQLLTAGIAAKSIEVLPYCSSCCTEVLFSHRAEKGKTGRMMAAVGIRN